MSDDVVMVLMHPDCFADLQRVFARDKWAMCWMRYRRDRRAGAVGELTPRAILERYCLARASLCEVGSLDDVRILK